MSPRPDDRRTNIVELREYTDARIDALADRVTELAVTAKEAIQERTSALNTRLDAMNEFRKSVDDIANKAATRHEMDAMKEASRLELDVLKEKFNDMRAQATVSSTLVSILVSVAMILLSRFVFR